MLLVPVPVSVHVCVTLKNNNIVVVVVALLSSCRQSWANANANKPSKTVKTDYAIAAEASNLPKCQRGKSER